MRPAREGRENGEFVRLVTDQHVASMRPAREGRENTRADVPTTAPASGLQ